MLLLKKIKNPGQWGLNGPPVLSNDVTSVHNFSLLFGIREIPSELGAKVKASPSSLPGVDQARMG